MIGNLMLNASLVDKTVSGLPVSMSASRDFETPRTVTRKLTKAKRLPLVNLLTEQTTRGILPLTG